MHINKIGGPTHREANGNTSQPSPHPAYEPCALGTGKKGANRN